MSASNSTGSEGTDGSDVAVVLVSHDGSSWLRAVLDGIAAQTAPIASIVAVDTGSRDGSLDLIESALLAGSTPAAVLQADATTSFPQAVARATGALADSGHRPEWLWLLHDDANPDPGALEALLEAARAHPEADILGPKLREWPSLKRLLELGVTISGTGRRETGLEHGEYDQGQHDEVREVLAVNTAGMLIRRSALEELGGFDEALPMFGNDVDLGWRAAAAGRTALVVPQAVVFHAEAAHRGVRRTSLTGRHTHFQERRAALYTLLANGRGGIWLPLQMLRLALGSVVRMLGYLVVRSVGEALDELAAMLSVIAHPAQILAARRARRERFAASGYDTARVRRLLAPWWLPYRHGLDFLGDLVAAATNQAADVAERRRLAAAENEPAKVQARHSSTEDELEDTGWIVSFFTSPLAIAVTIIVVALLIGARSAFGDIGGALSPAPSGRGTWWDLHLDSWHAIGFGTSVPAPGYVAPLALLGSILGPGLTMSLLLVGAPVAALWGAWRFLRVVARLATPRGANKWLLLWGSTTYALVPLVAGAWGSGRWGVVVAAALLPWMGHAALGFADPEPERRWRASWRAGLLLTLLAAVMPVIWWLVLVLALVVLAMAALLVRAAVAERSVWGPPVAALGVPLLLLSPWWLPLLYRGAAEGLFLDIGRWPTAATDGLHLLLGRFQDAGAPEWLGVVLPVLALVALIPRATRVGVLVCWLVAAVAGLVALPLARISIGLPDQNHQQPGLGAVVLVLAAAWITAAVLGSLALRDVVLGRLVQAAVGVLGIAAIAVPLVGLVWFAVAPGNQLPAPASDGVPVFMEQQAEQGDQYGILVLRGDVDHGMTFQVIRGDGRTVGEDEIEALTPADPEVHHELQQLVTAPSRDAVAYLQHHGIAYVVEPYPADGAVAQRLDATSGLSAASADTGTRAWQVDLTQGDKSSAVPAPTLSPGPHDWLRIVLLIVQLGGTLVIIVLALPQIRRSRHE